MNRRWMALLLAGLLLAGGALTGCQLEEERKVVSTAPEDQPVENDGEEALLDCLERNEERGVVYHREGIVGDYDEFEDPEELIRFLRTGKE